MALSTNKNTVRERVRVAAMNEDERRAYNERKAVNERARRVRVKLAKKSYWSALSPQEQAAAVDAEIARLEERA